MPDVGAEFIAGIGAALIVMNKFLGAIIPSKLDRAVGKLVETMSTVKDQTSALYDAHLGPAAKTDDGGLKWYSRAETDVRVAEALEMQTKALGMIAKKISDAPEQSKE